MSPPEIHRLVAVGVGMRPGTAATAILTAVRHAVGDETPACLATIDRRGDEPGLREAAAELGIPVCVFTAAELDAVAIPTPAARTKAAVGAAGVAEAAAILAAGGGTLLRAKEIHGDVTVAVARRSG
ncbi:cobalt-precorrin 5A hydrolase [Nocardia amikacinitolerans]|uniref:cobalamin biosynthesis protein n=1 Tax=Nocardia amikacinitolerans TaxID=756689 RepID=UPI0020A4BB78|nr:cobalamin biosynthesis protein [Nocardia amikacinitolerans]MCP2299456.1 cobalt-precorrin 5A hydrolase [Nocardia amikacinitolerans]